MLEPLLELRAQWRQSANNLFGADSKSLVVLLEHALDFLIKKDQLNREGLEMVIEQVCNSIQKETPETISILRDRLRRGIDEYLDRVPDEEYTETRSLEELSESIMLFLQQEEDIQSEKDTQTVEEFNTKKHVSNEKIEKELHKALLLKQRQQEKPWRRRTGKIFEILRILIIIVLLLGAFYFITHPQKGTKTIIVPVSNTSIKAP